MHNSCLSVVGLWMVIFLFSLSQIYNIFFSVSTYDISNKKTLSPTPQRVLFQAFFWPSFLVLPFTAIGGKNMFGVEGSELG